jgi:deoxyadenosine/deoxycytidine kinase
MTGRLISLIGPPAVGKTTLAEALAERLGAYLVREDYAGNPFLAGSYVGPEAMRLPGQLYFLLSRVAQLSPASLNGHALIVSDYGFCQDDVFARLRLSPADYRLYRPVLDRCREQVRAPDVVVAMDASPATLLERIARRGRPFESAMDEAFLQTMREAYRRLRSELACPVLAVDGDACDVRDPAACAELIEQLRGVLS